MYLYLNFIPTTLSMSNSYYFVINKINYDEIIQKLRTIGTTLVVLEAHCHYLGSRDSI